MATLFRYSPFRCSGIIERERERERDDFLENDLEATPFPLRLCLSRVFQVSRRDKPVLPSIFILKIPNLVSPLSLQYNAEHVCLIKFHTEATPHSLIKPLFLTVAF